MLKRNACLRLAPILILLAFPRLAVVQVESPSTTNVTRGFSLKQYGGVSLSTSGAADTTATGYAEILQAPGTAPSGLEFLSYRQNDVLISETAISASRPIRSGRIYAEMSDSVDTGLAIANPNDSPVSINFFFSNATGNVGSGTTTIPAKDHVAAFLSDTSVFKGPSPFQGTLSFTASAPIAAAAIHGLRNERGEFLMSTLSVLDMDAPASQFSLLPHFADGAGWTTQILLVNPTDSPLTGVLEFRDDAGVVLGVEIAGASGNLYSIPARSSQKLVTRGLSTLKSGSIRVVPAAATAPVAMALFSYKPDSTTLSETISIGTATGAKALRTYAEYYGAPDEPGSVRAGVALTNASGASADVTVELFNIDGSKLGLPAPVTFILPAYGHTAKFLDDIFANGSLPNRFQGTVRISTTAASGIAAVGLRARLNERRDFLAVATTPIDESLPPVGSTTFFPQIAGGSGYATQFILINRAAGTATTQGTLQVVSKPGSAPLSLLPAMARASGSIAITTDGSRVFNVNPDSASVSVIDGRDEKLIAEIPVGKDPGSIALSPDDRFAFVTNRESSTLTVVDTQTLQVRSSAATDAEPYGVVVAPAGNVAYVASAAQYAIDIFRIADGQAAFTSRIAVGSRPKGLAISSDGSTLYVTHFLSGAVSVISTLSARVTQVIATGADSNMVQKIAISPGNHRAYLPHLRSNVTNPFLLFDTTVFPTLSVLDLDHDRSAPAERVDLSVGAVSVNMPVDVAFSTDGARLYSVQMGSGDLAVIDLQARQRTALIDVGDGPSGVVVSPDGGTAFVNNTLSDDVAVVDLQALRVRKRITVTRSPLSELVHRGKVLFFSSLTSEVSRDRWMSCASCHFDAEQDGRTWIFSSGPRNTTSLRGVADTLPLHWSADRDEVQDFEFTIRTLQAGTGLIRSGEPNPELGASNAGRSPDLDALAAYVMSLQVKPSPFGGNVERGRSVFNDPDTGCSTCHSAPLYADSTMKGTRFILHDVGTGDGPGERVGASFDTPSLRGIWDTAPYLHDGSAPTLRDVLITRNPQDRHGRTSQLSDSQISDLIAFLRSL